MLDFLPEFSFLIPFLFTFAVVFGVLSTLKNYRKVKDEEGKVRGEIPSDFLPKGVNVLIALVFGFVTASYEPFAELIMAMLPLASVIVVVLFFFILVKKIFDRDIGDTVPLIAFLAIFLLAVGTFWGNLSNFMNFDYSTSKDVLWIVGLLAVGALFYFGSRPGSSSGGKDKE